MRTAKPGSLMIELLVYIMLSAMVIIGILNWVSRSSCSLASLGQSNNEAMSLYSAMDMLVRDMRQAPDHKKAWKLLSSESIVWNSRDNDIGWTVKNKNLYRIKGSYDDAQHRWKHQRKSLVAQNVDVSFEIAQKDETLTFIDCRLATEKHAIDERIYLRKGAV